MWSSLPGHISTAPYYEINYSNFYILIFWDGASEAYNLAIEKAYKNITAAYVLGLNELGEIDCEEIICLFNLC